MPFSNLIITYKKLFVKYFFLEILFCYINKDINYIFKVKIILGGVKMKEILIKILIQMVLDEERRKKIYIMIISVVTGLLMLIAFFYT